MIYKVVRYKRSIHFYIQIGWLKTRTILYYNNTVKITMLNHKGKIPQCITNTIVKLLFIKIKTFNEYCKYINKVKL